MVFQVRPKPETTSSGSRVKSLKASRALLKPRLLDSERRAIEHGGTSNSEAYIEYLRGIFLFGKRSEAEMREAVQHFEQAVGLEPDYAVAMAWLSRCYVFLGLFGNERPDVAFPKAREFALRALGIDESLSEAHAAIGIVEWWLEGDWEKALVEMERAVLLNPNSVEARVSYASYLQSLGRNDEALSQVRKALELDPLSVTVQDIAGNIYGLAGRSTEAIAHFDRALELNPESTMALNDLGLHLVSVGRTDDGVKQIEKAVSLASEGSPFLKGSLAYAYAVSGRREDALRIVAELKAASEKVSLSYLIAYVYTGLGDTDEALDWLEKTFNEHRIDPSIRTDPVFSSLGQEPRFQELIKKLGLEKYPAGDARNQSGYTHRVCGSRPAAVLSRRGLDRIQVREDQTSVRQPREGVYGGLHDEEALSRARGLEDAR